MELSTICLLFVPIISLLILVSSHSRKSRADRKKRRPPGPYGLPFIGSIHHLLTSQPQAALRDLANKHGPVMYLRLGQVDTVVVSSPEAAQEVLRANDISFASRPNLLGAEIICYGNLDVAFAPYGDYWRSLRKLCTLELLSARKVREFSAIRDRETMSLVAELQAAGGEPVNLGDLLVSCTNSVTGLATFGDRCSSGRRERFLSAMAVALNHSSGFCISDLFPSMLFVDVATGVRRRLQRVHRKLDQVFDEIIADCESRREHDLLSILLRIRDEGDFEVPIKTTNIKAIIVGLFTAGTGSTSSVAEWVMSELIKNPEMMAKAQAEVRQAFNNKNTCEHESNLHHLHYLSMVIKETMRLHPPVPLLLPRLCRETCDIGGFEVAKGTRVIVNSWAIARSPEYWDDSEKFNPERFEKIVVDYKGTQFEYMPFGSGRRMCPGSGFGLASLELILARLLYHFDWSLLAGMQPHELDMDMRVGATARRSNQLHLVASPYKDSTKN
ncbi:hypothetical protein HU200_023565 [Digitaria exilis]|uniref:Cytochrome P450 n=1 Tax=Digitaria exilis TaxID=1010633 RepID=A0A835C2L9_9POAL|nr:hypothetical protein HU200_023565 [Digitaria exilis]